MKRNMGVVDRLIRTFIGLGIILFYTKGLIPVQVAFLLLVIAGVLIITSIFAICPLYYMFGISTCSKKKASQ
jgi:hypothetical protein